MELARPWIEEARRRLLSARTSDGTWGYQRTTQAAVEATAVCGLSLLASSGAESAGIEVEVGAAADWLASVQNDNGSLGVSGMVRRPEWPTPYALLLWSALGGYQEQRMIAVRWLLRRKGIALAQGSNGAVGDDTSIVGWPWIEGTYSWLEPTAISTLALRREGYKSGMRVREGVRLVSDRAIATGGWNYGCGSVFGQALRPQTGMTGLALMSLAGFPVHEGTVEDACRYLGENLRARASERALCWGLLGLRAWGREPSQSKEWLETRFRSSQRRETPVTLSHLLLGAGTRSLALMGIDAKKGKA